MELIKQANNDEEREVIGIVALLDVDDEILLKMMRDVHLPQHHIIHCREKVKKIVMEKIKKN